MILYHSSYLSYRISMERLEKNQMLNGQKFTGSPSAKVTDGQLDFGLLPQPPPEKQSYED
jgi:hypothetical protein